jgi:hypothetical protein
MVVHNGQEYVKELIKNVGIVSDELIEYMPMASGSYFDAVRKLKKEGIVKRAKPAIKDRYTYGTIKFLEDEGCPWRKTLRREGYARGALRTIIPARFLIANYTVGEQKIDYHPDHFGKNYWLDMDDIVWMPDPLPTDPFDLLDNMPNDTYMPLQEIRSRIARDDDSLYWESALTHTIVNGVLMKWNRLHLVYPIYASRFSYIFGLENRARIEIEKYAGPIESAILIWRDKEVMLEHKSTTKFTGLKSLYREGVIGTDLTLEGLGEADKLHSMRNLCKIR